MAENRTASLPGRGLYFSGPVRGSAGASELPKGGKGVEEGNLHENWKNQASTSAPYWSPALNAGSCDSCPGVGGVGVGRETLV